MRQNDECSEFQSPSSSYRYYSIHRETDIETLDDLIEYAHITEGSRNAPAADTTLETIRKDQGAVSGHLLEGSCNPFVGPGEDRIETVLPFQPIRRIEHEPNRRAERSGQIQVFSVRQSEAERDVFASNGNVSLFQRVVEPQEDDIDRLGMWN